MSSDAVKNTQRIEVNLQEQQSTLTIFVIKIVTSFYTVFYSQDMSPKRKHKNTTTGPGNRRNKGAKLLVDLELWMMAQWLQGLGLSHHSIFEFSVFFRLDIA